MVAVAYALNAAFNVEVGTLSNRGRSPRGGAGESELAQHVDLHAVTEVFIEGFARLQRVMGDVHRDQHLGIPFLYFGGGRRGARFVYEFFPIGAQPELAVRAATEIAGTSQHMISAIGCDSADEQASYTSAGYERWGHETLMARTIAFDDALVTDDEVVLIQHLDLGSRVESAQREAGLRPHPITADHLDDPAIAQRVVLVDDQPASFGRIIAVGDAAYVSDIVTLPAYRGRGLANRLVRRLLADAAKLGCRRSILTSSPMGHGLYRKLGFEEVTSLGGYETPRPGAALGQ